MVQWMIAQFVDFYGSDNRDFLIVYSIILLDYFFQVEMAVAKEILAALKSNPVALPVKSIFVASEDLALV